MRFHFILLFLLETSQYASVWTTPPLNSKDGGQWSPPTRTFTPPVRRRCALDGTEEKKENIWFKISRRSYQQKKLRDMYPRLDVGLKRNKTYNPSYGYEAYWPEGDWLQRPPPTTQTGTTVTEICGSLCNEIYIKYGEVCARKKGSSSDYYEYETVENYCVIEKKNCLNKHTPGQGWLAVYRGKCLEELKRYPGEVMNEDNIRSSVPVYLNRFKNKYGSWRTAPTTPRRARTTTAAGR